MYKRDPSGVGGTTYVGEKPFSSPKTTHVSHVFFVQTICERIRGTTPITMDQQQRRVRTLLCHFCASNKILSGTYKLGDVAPKLAPSAWVAPTAAVVGNVELKEGASVWFGATIRGDNGA